MERLTSPTLKESFKHCVDAWSDDLLRKEFWKYHDRLVAYEDTELEPEEIKAVQKALDGIPFGRFREIMEAERDGRLPVLEKPNTLYQNDGFYCNICQMRHERAQKLVIGRDVFTNKQAALEARNEG